MSWSGFWIERGRRAATRREQRYSLPAPPTLRRVLAREPPRLGPLEWLWLAFYVVVGSPRQVLRVLWWHLTDRDTPKRKRWIRGLAEDLGGRLGPGCRVLVGYFERRLYSRDVARVPRALEKSLHRTTPLLVVQPHSEVEIRAAVAFATEQRLPIYPRGVSSSPFGGAVPTSNGIVLDLSFMMEVLEVDARRRVVRVQPGARWADLDARLERLGLGLFTTPTSRFSTVVAAGPQRFSTPLATFRAEVDRQRCTDCGLCIESCRHQVHHRRDGKLALGEPHHWRCIGPDCMANDWCCMRVCPWEAIRVARDPVELVLGDRRWTASLLRSTWRQARTGVPDGETTRGASGGGFDTLVLRDPDKPATVDAGEVDLSMPLNRRPGGPRITLPLPLYSGGMSYGSISLQVMLGRAMAAQQLGTLTCTGEGGYPDELVPYADHVITQIATGLFGVREETILRSRVVEFKYAQGAKPGLGGHLLGEKNTPRVAAMRQAVPGTSLFSPFPFHSVYSVEDHKKHLDWIWSIHPEVLISVKVSTPGDVDMVAVGSYYAGAHIVHLDGSYGGTGAAPDIAKKNIAQPIEYATAQAHDFLVKEGIRDAVTLIVSGGIRTPEDLLQAVALGADGVVIGTAELVAIDCVRCGNCERGRGCPIGIATTDAVLSTQLTAELVRDRIVKLYASWAATMRRRLAAFGLRAVSELRGRRDLLQVIEEGRS